MKTKLGSVFLLLIFIMIKLRGIAQTQEWPGIRDSIYSNVLKETRKIQVVLPKDYKSDSKEKYEVLYVLDGEWYMQQIPFIYNFTANSGYTPQNIFVLIPNTYVDKVNLRDRDFSPTKIDNNPTLGGADNFHSFLKDELIPYVEKKYPANGDRSLVGSSFSGLFSVYAFVKEPQLFQSFVASDPNLNWDNNYVSKFAAKKLPEYSGVSSTLFIAGLSQTFGDMGIASMDTVLRAWAPASIHWQCIPYENETHYSVQHKAFYDGFRFSHFGYGTTSPEFHPMNGIVEPGKPLKLFLLRENPALRYSIDGTEPTANSPMFSRKEQVSVSGPTQLKIKSFSNRLQYVHAFQGNFSSGSPVPTAKISKSSKAGLKYYFYEGDWNKPPVFEKSKPTQSGVVDEKFAINSLKGQKNSAYLIEGLFDIPEDGYYIFYSQADNGSKASIGDQLLFESDGVASNVQSFAIPLKKGLYSLRLEFFRQKGKGDINFLVFRTNGDNDRWWETNFFKL